MQRRKCFGLTTIPHYRNVVAKDKPLIETPGTIRSGGLPLQTCWLPFSLGCIILLPMLIDSIRDFDQSSLIFRQFQQFSRGKELNTVLLRVAQ
jgi:hypothetical protein